MRRIHIEVILSLLLMVSLGITGMLGYLQSELELRRFVPHRYAAYITLCLAAIHVALNVQRLWHYFLSLRKASRD